MTSLLGLLGGGGALVAAIWLWRLQTITRLIKFLCVALVLLGGLSSVGIVSISVDVGAAWDAAVLAWELVWRLWSALS